MILLQILGENVIFLVLTNNTTVVPCHLVLFIASIAFECIPEALGYKASIIEVAINYLNQQQSRE